jgi:radical SAM-linked protein
MEDKETLQEKFRFVLMHLKKYPSIRLKRDSLDRSILECVFSRGDRKLNDVLYQAWKSGARFDSWDDVFRFTIWEKAFESANVDYRTYLSGLDKRKTLPWEHIDTGFTKYHLLEELKLAMEEKASPSCSERECAECQGCSYPKSHPDRFDEDVTGIVEDSSSMGKRIEKVQRYRAYFRKTGQARYLSHRDLNNIIQQGFRRTGVRVSYSQGFHPKMLISYPPALPLGMEGKAEWVEFRSPRLFSEKDFLSSVNPKMNEGVAFYGLTRLDEAELPMNKKIRAFVYSLDLGDRDVIDAAKKNCLDGRTEGSLWAQIKRCVDTYVEGTDMKTIESYFVDENEKKLFLIMKNVARKGERPQEIVAAVFGLANPVFFMARERFLLNEKTDS